MPLLENQTLENLALLTIFQIKEIAIVTDQPGTTRDIIESYIDLKGVPVRFFDTAGIRKSKNVVENIGIKKAKNLSKKC